MQISFHNLYLFFFFFSSFFNPMLMNNTFFSFDIKDVGRPAGQSISNGSCRRIFPIGPDKENERERYDFHGEKDLANFRRKRDKTEPFYSLRRNEVSQSVLLLHRLCDPNMVVVGKKTETIVVMCPNFLSFCVASSLMTSKRS